MRSLTKTGIRILSAKYRSILIKCAIINASVFIGVFGASPSFADDVYVSSWMGLKGAIAGDANPINVYEDITRGASDEDITISRTLSIIGTETGKYLSGADTYKGLAIASDTNLTLENITMQNFKNSDFGGAIYNEGTISITGDFTSNSTTGAGGAIANYFGGTIYNIEGDFSENSATEYDGGAIANMYGTIHNIEGDFTSNSADGAGGAIYNTGTIEGITGNFEQNSANLYGGAIYNSGTIGTATGGIEGKFENNTAAQKGGAIYNEGMITSITGVDDGTGHIVAFNGNKVTSDSANTMMGGAIYNATNGSILNIEGNFISNEANSTASSNPSASGGAIYNEGTISNIKGDFILNTATTNGGAVNNNGSSSKITNIIGNFSHNFANGGGAIYNFNGGEISNIAGDFESNSATTNGGAINNFNASSKIGNIAGNFKGNHADTNSGAIYNGGIIENIIGDFENNSATNMGGAIVNSKTINKVTGDFTKNSAKNGGAVYNANLTINFVAENSKNITFSGNYVTDESGNGGAIFNATTGTVGLYASEGCSITFTGNAPTVIPEGVTAYNVDSIHNINILNINGDGTITPYTGTVNLYNVTDAATAKGTTNIYGGTVNAAKDITQNNINVLSGATLSSTTNGASIVATTFVNAGTVNMSGDSSKLLAENLTNNGIIDAISVVTEDSLTNNNTLNATGIEVAGLLTNNETIDAVNLLATQITNNGNITATDIMLGSATNNSGASLTVNGKVNSMRFPADLTNKGEVTFNGDEEKRLELTNSGTANFNGKLDGANSRIMLTQNAGVMNFSTDAIDSTTNLPVYEFVMNGGSVNIADGSINTLHINQLPLSGNTNFAIDADLAGDKMDQLNVTSVSGGGNIVVSDIKLLSDANDDYVELSLFADDSTKGLLADKVSGNLNGLKYSPIYKYDALYDQTTGKIGFTRTEQLNPYIYTPSVVANTTAAMTTQIATLAMDKMDDIVHAQGRSGGDTTKSSNAWVKVMGLNDNVEFNNFENIDSKALTVAAGYNTNKITCGDCGIIFGAYAGYIGGKQHYTANDIDQNGGYVGLSSALTLGNAFLTATVNGGLLKNKANNMYGSDRFNTLWLGTGLKAGYNYALTDSVVLQPNVYGGYTLVNTKDYTSVSGVKIATNNLNFFEIDPGLKLSAVIADGWTGSVQGKYAIVMDNGADITANDIALQNISTKNYIEYGIGIDKSVTDAFYLGAKVNRHDGGRTGWNGSIEFRYKF